MSGSVVEVTYVLLKRGKEAEMERPAQGCWAFSEETKVLGWRMG